MYACRLHYIYSAHFLAHSVPYVPMDISVRTAATHTPLAFVYANFMNCQSRHDDAKAPEKCAPAQHRANETRCTHAADDWHLNKSLCSDHVINAIRVYAGEQRATTGLYSTSDGDVPHGKCTLHLPFVPFGCRKMYR